MQSTALEENGFFIHRGLTKASIDDILCLSNKYSIYTVSTDDTQRGDDLEIILSSASQKPIYEQITSQIKGMIMSGDLKSGDPMPSMRGLAKDLHISVITAQHAYEDLQRDGFITTVAGKGTFVAAQNKDFIREEQLRLAEEKLYEAAQIGRENHIQLEQLIRTLTMFYEEDE